jgi:Flp pilus assembly pilin Flp
MHYRTMRGKLPVPNQETQRCSAERDEGQTMAEYAIVLGVITLAIVTSFGVLSGAIKGLLDSAASLFS